MPAIAAGPFAPLSLKRDLEVLREMARRCTAPACHFALQRTLARCSSLSAPAGADRHRGPVLRSERPVTAARRASAARLAWMRTGAPQSPSFAKRIAVYGRPIA